MSDTAMVVRPAGSLAAVTPMTTDDLIAHVQIIKDVMSRVMVKGVHYDVIPGCGKKPVLLKSGAEMILMTFKIRISRIDVEDLSAPDVIRYRVTVHGVTAMDIHLGVGIGECSSDETKYRWRKATCRAEYEATAADRRQTKIDWYDGKGVVELPQVRRNPADVANTVLKMAKKRAVTDFVIGSTGASEVVTQDTDQGPIAEITREDRASRNPGRRAAQVAAEKAVDPPQQFEVVRVIGLTEETRESGVVIWHLAVSPGDEAARRIIKGLETMESAVPFVGTGEPVQLTYVQHGWGREITNATNEVSK